MIRLLLLCCTIILSHSAQALLNRGGGSNVTIQIEITQNDIIGIGNEEDYDFYAVLGTTDTSDTAFPNKLNYIKKYKTGNLFVMLNCQGFSRPHTANDIITVCVTYKPTGARACVVLSPAPIGTLQSIKEIPKEIWI